MKEQQLKEQFLKWEQKNQVPNLDSDHALQFQMRLNKRKKRIQRKRIFQWAAVAVLCIGLGGAFQLSQEQLSEEVVQFQKAEFHLMQLIEEQLTSFENSNSPTTQLILKRSKKQLELIQKDYQKIYDQWEVNTNQPQLIQALIENLNTQINLLAEIRNTLKTIENNTYEDLTI
ncbi:hypothetical protein N9H57_07015 [Flavobacteriaceae bacterium]|nr:hypothetical protein [Flavobacteriaceae bacterium]